jgi:hypothetical protein
MTALNFLFRKPRLPIIIDTGVGLVGAKSWGACRALLAQLPSSDLTPRDVIDATAEAFSFYPQHMAFSPLTVRKRWTKMTIIELYNSSKGPGRPAYPTTSLGNKPLEKVIQDIVELLATKK